MLHLFLTSADSVIHSECTAILLDSIRSHSASTASNTCHNFWEDGFGCVAVLALLVSIFTAVAQGLTTSNTNKLDKKTQKKLLEDLVRHLYRNLVIVCTAFYKMEKTKKNGQYTNYPSEEHLYKLKIPLEKIQLNLFLRDSNYEKVEKLYLNFRNYNTEIDVICEHFKNPQIDYATKLRDFSTLIFKSGMLTEEIINLAKVIYKKDIEVFIKDVRKKVNSNFESSKGNTLTESYATSNIFSKEFDKILLPMLNSYTLFEEPLYKAKDGEELTEEQRERNELLKTENEKEHNTFIAHLKTDITIETGRNLSGGEKIHLINL